MSDGIMDDSNMNYFISFIIPAYNESERLHICLDSIIKQNTELVEIILIDDASTDETYSIMQSYSEKYPFIKLFHVDENQGQSHARNIGLEYATGEYVWFVDADDYIADDAVRVLFEKTKGKNLDCVYFFNRRVMGEYEFDSPRKIELATVPFDTVLTGMELFRQIVDIAGKVADTMSCCIVKRDLIEKENIRFLENAVYEDGMFGLELYLKSNRVIQLNSTLYSYYNNIASTGHRTDPVFDYACSFVKYCYYLEKGFQNATKDEEFVKSYRKALKTVFQYSHERYIKLKKDRDPFPIINSISKKAGMLYYSIYENDEWDNAFEKEEELQKALLSDKDIIIYGAGKKAKELAIYLDCYEKKILTYVVSDEYKGDKYPLNPKSIYGVPVTSLSETSVNSKDVIVLCTTRKVHEDVIRRSLERKGFDDIVFL